MQRKGYRRTLITVTVLLVLTAWFNNATKIELSASEATPGLQAGGCLLPGTGTAGDPWRIENLADLEYVRQLVASGESFTDKYLSLYADIQLPDDWQGIGSLKEGATDPGRGRNILPFGGIFDGENHRVTAADGGNPLFEYVRGAVIRNLRISGRQINGNGLIRRYVADYGEKGTLPVKTARIENVTICSGTSTLASGIVSGYAAAGNTVDIIGCTAEEGVIIGYDGEQQKIGSFGGDYNGIVKDCVSAATVCGTSYVGGIIGCRGNSMSTTSVINCVFNGRVIASESCAGGIAGGGYGGTGWGIDTAPNALMMVIRNCLCTGTVEAADIAGGIEGFETTVQVWNDGFLTGNLFTGSVSCTEGSCIGGIIGKMKGIDRCNIIKDNYFSGDCGADRGIGGVQYVDTSYTDHEIQYGELYFNTGVEVPIIPGVNDEYPNNLRPNYNRQDDPLGKDASGLAKEVSDIQLSDGTVTTWLNQAEGSLKNWTQGAESPEIQIDPMITDIQIRLGYQTEYALGSPLDQDDMEFILSWSDGHEDLISGKDENLTIDGYDSSEQACLDLTATYSYTDRYGDVQKACVSFPVRVLVPDDGSSKTLYFTLLGDQVHGPDADCGIHTRAKSNLEEWIGQKEYEAGPNDTAKDLILRVLQEEGLEYKDNGDSRYGSYCITGIQIPEKEIFLSQFSNGENSRWLLAVNGENLTTDADRYYLKEGDELILFYTDDSNLEKEEDPEGDGEQDKDPNPPVPDKKDSSSESLIPSKKITEGQIVTVEGNTYKVTGVANSNISGTLAFIKANNTRKIHLPDTVKLADSRFYKVTVVKKKAFQAKKIRKVIIGKNVDKMEAGAFEKSKCTTVVLKTRLLKKASVKKCFKQSKVQKVYIKAGDAKVNKKVKKKYKKIFNRKITGRKVKIS